MWSTDYNVSSLSLDMELTTFCNARCPQCSRTDEFNNLNKKKWLPLTQISISKFKKWLPPEDISHIRNFHFSGTYGDPGMCKDLYKIVCYIIDNSTTTTISINTNGGMRNTDFWWDIGAKGQDRIKIIFDVDGINQEMHEFYRRGVELSRVLDNMSAVLQTPATVSVLTILFKHNEEYLEQIQDMCRNMGVKNFDSVEANNFRNGPIYKFNDEQGQEVKLEQITRKDREQGLERLSRRIRDHRHAPSIKEYTKINCLAIKEKNLKIHASGLVAPCCYLSTPLEMASGYKGPNYSSSHITTSGIDHDEINPLMKKYISNHQDFNLNYTRIKDIVYHPWFNKSLPDSWNNFKDSCFGCRKVCGKK